MEAQTGFASAEDILSGRGIELLHSWEGFGEPASATSDEIMNAAQAGDERALKTIEMFVGLFASALGDLALIHLPFGGIYLIGGMARAVTPYFEVYEFEAKFYSKGRFKDLMEEFSIHVVEDDFAALNGCLSFLEEQIA